MRGSTLLFLLSFVAILYLGQLFIVSTDHYISNEMMTTKNYLFPLFIIIFFALALFISKKIKDPIYCLCYYIMGIYLGYILYVFQMALVIRILSIIFSFSTFFGMFLLYFIPILICVYGMYNAIITKVKRITLKYPGYIDRINILHLSDIHLGAIHQKNSVMKIVREIEELCPDIVVITGDMADGSLQVKPDWLIPFDNLDIPILFVTGNHEEMNPKVEMIYAVNSTKIKYIGENEQFQYKGVNFIGIDYGYDLNKCLANVRQIPGVPNVLLCHVPLLEPKQLASYNIFLFLAGHTHGGQLFPFHLFAYLLNACFKGLYRDQENQHFVYVTEGVNGAVTPMRVLSSREFSLITIVGQ